MTSVTPPTWLDAAGRRRPTLAWWVCGRKVAPMRLRAGDLQRMEWTPPETRLIPDWCGCSIEYLPVGWRRLVAPRADLGARSNAESSAALAAGCAVLGEGSVIPSLGRLE